MDYTKFQTFEARALGTVYSEFEGGFHDDLIPQIAQRFLPEFGLDPQARILDIGCGPGVFIRAAAELGFHDVTGVTLSHDDVVVCQRSGFKVIEASMTDLPVPDNTVDFIWCRHALEHSPYPLFTLYEFHRVLNDQGQILIEVPSPDNERTYMHEFNPNHYSILGEKMWMGLFDKAGFNTRAFWNYSIDLPLDNRMVRENSYVFAVGKVT